MASINPHLINPLCVTAYAESSPSSRKVASRDTLNRVSQALTALQQYDFGDDFGPESASGYRWLLSTVECAVCYAESLLQEGNP
jgi:hypothetical protein